MAFPLPPYCGERSIAPDHCRVSRCALARIRTSRIVGGLCLHAATHDVAEDSRRSGSSLLFETMEGSFTFEAWHIVLAVAIIFTIALRGWLEGL